MAIFPVHIPSLISHVALLRSFFGRKSCLGNISQILSRLLLAAGDKGPYGDAHQYHQCHECADSSGNVPVGYEECLPVLQPGFRNYVRRLPPFRFFEYVATRTDDGGDAGIGTPDYVSACLDGPEAGISEMLAITRSVAPLGIICNDRKETCSLSYIFNAMLGIH